jgi:hypothetical protein
MRAEFIVVGLLSILGFTSSVACSAPVPEGADQSQSRVKSMDESDKKANDGASGSNSSGADTSGSKTSGSKTSGADASGGKDPPPTDDAAAKQCAAKPTVRECSACCDDAVPGAQKKQDAATTDYFACVCAANACATECAGSLCGSPQSSPSKACSDCWDTNANALKCYSILDESAKDPVVVKANDCKIAAACFDKEL